LWINYTFIKKLFSLLNVDPTTFTGKFSSNDVKNCVDWLTTAKVELGDFEQNVSAILNRNMLNVKSGTVQSYSLNTLKQFFKENFALTIETRNRPTINGVREYMYQFQRTDTSGKAEDYYKMIYSHE
jgi:hypothetical protein